MKVKRIKLSILLKNILLLLFLGSTVFWLSNCNGNDGPDESEMNIDWSKSDQISFSIDGNNHTMSFIAGFYADFNPLGANYETFSVTSSDLNGLSFVMAINDAQISKRKYSVSNYYEDEDDIYEVVIGIVTFEEEEFNPVQGEIDIQYLDFTNVNSGGGRIAGTFSAVLQSDDDNSTITIENGQFQLKNVANLYGGG